MTTYRQSLRQLRGAQKTAARGAPAYSRFINRRLGRYLAAGAHQLGLAPNHVTAISAVFTFSGIALLAFGVVGWITGIAVGTLLVIGYALDSADGQLARLTGTGNSAGEWLDHMVDAAKTVSLPLALLVGLYRSETIDPGWLIVPLLAAVFNSVLFFGMILTEQLRRAHGVQSRATTGGKLPWLRSALLVPTDYGLLCLVFLLYGSGLPFLVLYTGIVLATGAFLVLAAVKWFRELRALTRA